MSRDRNVPLERVLAGAVSLSSTMSYNPKEIPVTRHLSNDSSETIPEERKGLFSNFDSGDCDNGELPHYGDGEYPRKRNPLHMNMFVEIARDFIFLILGAVFLVPMWRSWCARMGTANHLTDPSRLLSNGTHEFKRTVLIVSIDGLR